MYINLFLCALLFCPTLCVPNVQPKQSDTKSKNADTKVNDEPVVSLKVDTPANSSPSIVKNDLNKSGKSPPIHNQTTSVAKTEKVLDENSEAPESNSSQVESGTVMRGVLVFGGLGLIFLIYVGVKTYRRGKKMPIIKKYGVRGRRSDVEMRPLPLDDDEEDETVFDLAHLSKP